MALLVGCGGKLEYHVEQPLLDGKGELVFTGPGSDDLRIRIDGEVGEPTFTRSRGNRGGRDYECEFLTLVAKTGKIVVTDVKLNGKPVPPKSE